MVIRRGLVKPHSMTKDLIPQPLAYLFLGDAGHNKQSHSRMRIQHRITHAKNNAPLSADDPFWRKTLYPSQSQPAISKSDHDHDHHHPTHVDLPEVISSNQTLPTRSDGRIAIIFTQLDRLIDPSVTITEVSRERSPEMNPETFCRAAGKLSLEMLPHAQTHKQKQ